MAQTEDILAARRFLSSGKPGQIPDAALAQACDQLVQEASRKSFARAMIVARKFAHAADSQSIVLRAAAFRALARVTHMSGRHRDALDSYLKARRLLAGDPLVRGRIDRALIDVYMYLGDFRKAKQAADAAIKAFTRVGSDNDLAQTQVNYANVLHRQDRHRQAEHLYRQASKFFTSSGNTVATARTNYNWANTLVQLFEFDQAERLYLHASKIYQEAGFDLDACDAQYGLAWLRMLCGDFHRALQDLAACEETYRKGGDPRGEALCLLDRAEVFLHLGLYHDAYLSARLAERRFAELKLRYESAKAALYFGQAAAAIHRRREGRAALTRARRAFADEKNSAFLGVCAVLEADLDKSVAASRGSLRNARKLFTRAELPLWQAVCDLRLLSFGSADSIGRLSANGAVKTVPHLFAIWQTLLGDHSLAHGNAKGARECWRRAADRIDSVRAQLPPFSLRRSYGKSHSLPHHRLIEFDLTRRPALAAAWSERHKTAGLWSPITDLNGQPARRRVVESLSQLSRQVAALTHQAGGLGARAAYSDGQRKQTRQLERQIREGMSELEHQSQTIVESESRLARRIVALSSRLPVIQFHLSDTDVVAFVHENRKTRVERFAGGRRRLSDLLGRMRFFVEGELLPAYPSANTRLTAELDLWEEFGDWLWRPLHLNPASPMLLVPEGELANVPWQAIRVDGQPLGDSYHFLLAPSIRHFLAAESRELSSSAVRLFRGPANDLPSIDTEMAALRELFGSRADIYSPSSRANWPDADDAAIWHFAGHAQMNEENPFYSYLLMSDGPLFAADFRLKRCSVGLVTLAACRSGEETAVPGEESTGLVRSLLEMGARTVIAPHWPVADGPAALWMSTFYTGYLAYDNVLDAARYAAQTVRQSFPSASHWAAFSVFGAGSPGGQDVV